MIEDIIARTFSPKREAKYITIIVITKYINVVPIIIPITSDTLNQNSVGSDKKISSEPKVKKVIEMNKAMITSVKICFKKTFDFSLMIFMLHLTFQDVCFLYTISLCQIYKKFAVLLLYKQPLYKLLSIYEKYNLLEYNPKLCLTVQYE